MGKSDGAREHEAAKWHPRSNEPLLLLTNQITRHTKSQPQTAEDRNCLKISSAQKKASGRQTSEWNMFCLSRLCLFCNISSVLLFGKALHRSQEEPKRRNAPNPSHQWCHKTDPPSMRQGDGDRCTSLRDKRVRPQ